MRLVKTAVIFVLFCALPVSAITERTPARIEIKSYGEVSELVKLGIDIDDMRETYIEVYCTEAEFEKLKEMGYEIVWIPNYAKIFADSLWEATKNTKNPMAEYHTYEELTAELYQIADSNSNICHLESIGQSVQGRELWFMKISDNVDIEENEPEFKYISTMHGDEPVGTELLLYLIHYLIDNYGTDPQVTFLVNETEIWIMPLMNPDGNAAHSRYNANGVDLNRNFPDRITDSVNTPEGRQPETQAVMNWAFDHSSVLSANFHTGALVVNYPYDSAENPYPHYEASPDDSLFIYISEAYSIHNEPMWNGYFYHGITNGADWYVIYGGMQDWNYVWLGCNEVTIELYGIKWPSPDVLPGLWEDNRDAMLAYMEKCHIGVRGIVTDSLGGEPLNATIDVVEIGHSVYTDPDVGNYHRMLLAGDYTLEFSSPEYVVRTFPGIHVGPDSLTTLDVRLYKPFGLLSGIVRDSITGNPIYGARVSVIGSPLSPVYTDSFGSYSVSPYQGTYDVRFTANGYKALTIHNLEIGEETVLDVNLLQYEAHYYVRGDTFSIPDRDTITDTLVIYDSLTVGDINVYLDITHTYTRDLIISLTSPQNTEVTLHNGSGRTFPYWFDVDHPADGPGSLSDFIGEMSNGNWILTVIDRAGGDTGRVNEWAIRLFTEPTGTEEMPTEHLSPVITAYPNPFRGKTVISYQLPGFGELSRTVIGESQEPITDHRSPITLTIYDLSGRLIKQFTIYDLRSTNHEIVWDGRDRNGVLLPAGIYFYRCRGEDFDRRGKLVMMR